MLFSYRTKTSGGGVLFLQLQSINIYTTVSQFSKTEQVKIQSSKRGNELLKIAYILYDSRIFFSPW